MPDTLPQPERRKPLTRIQFATLILAQEGRCGCGCGKKLQADRIIDEHVQALDFLGSNDLGNRSLWDVDCSKAKTAGDLKAAAKGKRIRGLTGQRARRAKRGGSSIKSGAKLQSRGFDRTKTKGFDGKVRDRV